jgi:hypothetical protein
MTALPAILALTCWCGHSRLLHNLGTFGCLRCGCSTFEEE